MTFLSDDQKASIRSKLQELQKHYASALPAKIEEIGNLWESQKVNCSENTISEAIRLTHNLAGTAKTYGFSDLGELAKEIEHQLLYLKNNPNDNEAANQMDCLMKKIRTAVTQ